MRLCRPYFLVGQHAGLLLALGLLVGLAGCRAAPSAPPAAVLPAGISGVLTYQRDGNVYLLPFDMKAERKLTDFPAASPAVFSARSPNGTRLAYIRVEGMGSALWLANADGSDARKIVDESTSSATLERPQWTPDGTAIIYTYHGFLMEGTAIKGEVIRAERVAPDGGERTVLAPDAEGPTLAPDGSLAFVRTTRSGQQLVLLDPGGVERVLVPDRTFLNLAAPRFSPDGRRIAFAAVGEGPKVGATSGQERGAQASSWWLTALSWVRGGLRLGPAVAYAHGEPWDIWVAEVGGGVRPLARLAEDEPTVGWGEGGRYLAVSGGTGVYIVDVSSGQTTQVAKAGGFGGIDWTP